MMERGTLEIEMKERRHHATAWLRGDGPRRLEYKGEVLYLLTVVHKN